MANDNLSEKVSVNINSSTLSSIDLLVDNGYYSNRSDFINHALRTTLLQHQNTIERVIEQNREKEDDVFQWFAGVFVLSAKDVESLYEKKKEIDITGYGVLIINDDVDVEMLFQTVKSIKVKGKIACSAEIKEHYNVKSK